MSDNDFYQLTPERILDAVEQAGLRCTGRVLALNSMENRVYEVEIDVKDESTIRSPSDRFKVVKFYRPGRWSKEQIQEEHNFLADLVAQEIPAIAPIQFEDGQTLHAVKDMPCFFAIFPKRGGRHPDELDTDELKQIGRLLARLHNVGASRKAETRLTLTPQLYARDNLKYLIESNLIPQNISESFKQAVEEIARLSELLFQGVANQRLHGDCHLGNVLHGRDGFFLVDFDDMINGPCIQDLWLLNPGRDDLAKQKLDTMLEGYTQMRDFDFSTLRLIEALRALRMIHFCSWVAKRWEDPAFKRVFVNFGTERYWQEELITLREQISFIHENAVG